MTNNWSHSGVILPSEVSDALTEDRLVFFCGAGVSIPDPSNLPSFLKLARDIAAAIHPTTDPESIDEHAQLDLLLGRLDEEHGNVHLRVEEMVGNAKLPNDIHRHIVRLQSQSTTRIVTTNFDVLFEAALEEGGVATTVYTAPALPLGDDFNGLVHLHGRVPLNSSERMVVTDRDFGRAYITEGWTTAFLSKLFSAYTVVFLGYSAQDTVIRYLARALPESGKLFAITPERQSANWLPLAVTPIPYGQPGGSDDHSVLSSFLAAWDESVTAPPEERFDYVELLHADGPYGDAFSDAERLWTLHHPQLSVQFMSLPATPEWVSWVGTHTAAKSMFALGDLDSALERWAGWFGRSLELGTASVIVELLARSNGKLSNRLWVHLTIGLSNTYASTPAETQLVMVLIAASEAREAGRLSMLLASVVKANPTAGEIVLRQLLAVEQVVRVQNPIFGTGPDLQFSALWDAYTLRETWSELHPQLTEPVELADKIIDVLTGIEASEALFRGQPSHDFMSRQRQAIESDRDNYLDGPLPLLVEMLQDLLTEEITERGIDRCIDLVNRRSQIVRRIALFCLAEAPAQWADRALHALVDGAFLFEYQSRPEAQRLLAASFGNASEGARAEIVDHILSYKDPTYPEWPSDSYRYEALEWAERQRTKDVSLASALSTLRTSYPDFVETEHPGNDSIALQFHRMDAVVPTKQFDRLSVPRVAAKLASERDWEDYRHTEQLISDLDRYLQRRPGAGPALLSALAAERAWSLALWRHVISRSASNSSIPELRSLVSASRVYPTPRDLASAFSRAVLPDSATLETESTRDLHQRLDLILELWERSCSGLPARSAPPTASWAYDDPTGKLAETYMRVFEQIVVRRRRRLLTAQERRQLDTLAGSGADPNNPTFLVLVRYSRILSYSDSDWYDLRVVPQFEATAPGASLAWCGMLSSFQWNKHIISRLESEFRTGLEWVRENLPASLEAFIENHSFLSLVVSSPNTSWPDHFIIHGTDTERAQWIRALGNYCRRFPERGDGPALVAWWQRRKNGFPLPIVEREQAALVSWLRLPGLDFELAADLFAAGPTIDGQTNDLSVHVDYENLPWDTNPVATGTIVLKLLEGSPYLPYPARAIADRSFVLAQADQQLARRLLGGLLSRGFTPARLMIQNLTLPHT